jgi:hypothetical protein
LGNEAAESYRKSVLEGRGPLRGLDYVLMRELVGIQDSIDQLRPARSVAEQLQFLAPSAETLPVEPRLVQVGGGTHAIALRTFEREAQEVKAAK